MKQLFLIFFLDPSLLLRILPAEKGDETASSGHELEAMVDGAAREPVLILDVDLVVQIEVGVVCMNRLICT